MRMRSLLCFLLLPACSDANADESRSCSAGAALYGGSPTPVSVAVDVAVGGGVVWPPGDVWNANFCTFTRVASRWLLTARHCLPPEFDGRVELTFGPSYRAAANPANSSDCRNPAPTLWSSAIERASAHAELDLALLEVELPLGPSLAVAETPATVGERLLLVGYGEQEDGGGGIQESLWENVSAKDATSITVIADHGGACVGDSGGPLLREVEPGEFELVGVLSSGSDSCWSFDHCVDIQAAKSWVDSLVLSAD